MSVISLTVNGRMHTVDVDPATPLLYVLSDDLEMRGPKFGCGLSQCGACTVIVDGEATRSCVTPVEKVAGSAITTLEGLGTVEDPHPIQQAFIDVNQDTGLVVVRRCVAAIDCGPIRTPTDCGIRSRVGSSTA